MEKTWEDVARIQAIRIIALEGILAGLNLIGFAYDGGVLDLLIALGWLTMIAFDAHNLPRGS